MTKAVLTSKPDSGYRDIRERQYHFPRTYLGQIDQSKNDLFVYYEPRRTSDGLSSIGGRQAYIGTGRISHIEDDPDLPGHHYAHVEEYIDFDRPVPFEKGGMYFESALRKSDGSTNKGAFGQSVRLVPDEEFAQIIAAGMGSSIGLLDEEPEPGFAEDPTPFERPIVEQLVSRPWRDRKFSAHIRNLYDATCAVTGLQIINGGGRAEIEAAHIRPIGNQHHGDDSVRNGIALSRTAHWMFDRGLISLSDDLSILIADNLLPASAIDLLHQDRNALVPSNPMVRPAVPYLEYHRDVIFKG